MLCRIYLIITAFVHFLREKKQNEKKKWYIHYHHQINSTYLLKTKKSIRVMRVFDIDE